ncbi:MAG: hypothetical protein V4482_04720 [Pseudomonadota bacterium]
MKKILTLMSLVSAVTLSTNVTFATNRAELVKNMAGRFELAATAFTNGHVDRELHEINQEGAPGDTSDAPSMNSTPASTFMSGSTDSGGGMTCYYSDTQAIVATANPKYSIGGKIDSGLAKNISDNIKNNVAEVESSISIIDPNNKSTQQESMLTIAWQGQKLTGSADSKLVCIITAPAPAPAPAPTPTPTPAPAPAAA